MQQNRAFRADKLLGFQWIPNTNKYVYYTDAGSKMMSASTTDSKAKELVTLTEINTALGTKLKSFTGLEWIDANTILISDNTKYYSYSLTSKSGKKIQEVSDAAENQTFDAAKQNLAFTEKTIYISSTKTKKKLQLLMKVMKELFQGNLLQEMNLELTTEFSGRQKHLF